MRVCGVYEGSMPSAKPGQLSATAWTGLMDREMGSYRTLLSVEVTQRGERRGAAD